MNATHSPQQTDTTSSEGRSPRLLVALGRLDSATEVLKTIAPLARAAQAQLDLLTVLDPGEFHDTPDRRARMSVTWPGKDVGWFGIGTGSGYIRIPERRNGVFEYASQQAEESHDDALDALMSLAHEYLAGLDVRFLVEESKDVPGEIARAAREVEADVIVIAGHHRTPLPEAIVGNVAQEVLDHAEIPVMMIPTPR